METEDEKKETKPEEVEKAKETKTEDKSESKADESKVNINPDIFQNVFGVRLSAKWMTE